MIEEEIAGHLQTYRKSLGTCGELPARPLLRRRLIATPIAAAFAIGATGFLLWPRDASAASLKRLESAISNANSMVAELRVQNSAGKWIPWSRVSYKSSWWRTESLINTSAQRVVMISRDGLCYDDWAIADHATVRPIEATIFPAPTRGQALDVLENELTHANQFDKLVVASSAEVAGHATYRVLLDKPGRKCHIDILVDKETDLPISADSAIGDQHSRWDYRFNMPLSDDLFRIPPGRKLVDLRKTIPALDALWKNPLAIKGKFRVLDACVTDDGAVWVATDPDHPGPTTVPGELSSESGHPVYSSGWLQVESKLNQREGVKVTGFVPLDPIKPFPLRYRMTIRSMVLPATTNSFADTTPAIEVSPVLGTVSFTARRVSGLLPNYFKNLGVENDIMNMPDSIAECKAENYKQRHRYLEAAKTCEAIGKSAASSSFDAFNNWMRQAEDCYRLAGKIQDANRIHALDKRTRVTTLP